MTRDEAHKRIKPEVSVEEVYNLLCEVNGIVYLENSEDKVDRVQAEVMRGNLKTTAQALKDKYEVRER